MTETLSLTDYKALSTLIHLRPVVSPSVYCNVLLSAPNMDTDATL
jgi:hypothetical protein